MKIGEIARLMGKSKVEVEELLKQNDVIELNLSERRSNISNMRKEAGELRIIE
jgi:hypothetical protein